LDKLEELLLQYEDRRFVLVHPTGGVGDELIFMGLESKMNELDIQYRVFLYEIESRFSRTLVEISKVLSRLGFETLKEMLTDVMNPISDLSNRKVGTINCDSTDIILLRGGAYLNDIWKNYSVLGSALHAIHNRPESVVIVSPQSYYFSDTWFPRYFIGIENEVHLFCREKYSYGLLDAINFPRNVHIHLSKDTAFYCQNEDFRLESGDESYYLVALRNDRESVVTWKARQMSEGIRILFGDVGLLSDFKSFVNIVGNATKVYTDRLHVAILSAILEKETYLYPNSYHKNKGVYEFSLRNSSNVRFINSEILDFDSFGSFQAS